VDRAFGKTPMTFGGVVDQRPHEVLAVRRTITRTLSSRNLIDPMTVENAGGAGGAQRFNHNSPKPPILGAAIWRRHRRRQGGWVCSVVGKLTGFNCWEHISLDTSAYGSTH
jgi:hypothetical protein